MISLCFGMSLYNAHHLLVTTICVTSDCKVYANTRKITCVCLLVRRMANADGLNADVARATDTFLVTL